MKSPNENEAVALLLRISPLYSAVNYVSFLVALSMVYSLLKKKDLAFFVVSLLVLFIGRFVLISIIRWRIYRKLKLINDR